MKRAEKLKKTSIMSIIKLSISTLSGLILPRLFIEYYGSEVNGLVNSITQFLGYISLLELGLCSVISSSLYKPLAKGNKDEISRIVISSEKFFRKIAFALIVYCLILMIFYPLFIREKYNYFYVASLILVLSVNSFVQYYFGITSVILLNADQKAYVHYFIESITLILNLCICVVLIKSDTSIQFVKLVGTFVFFLQPIFNMAYVRKHYEIRRNVIITEEPIKQKKYGIAQHLAHTVFQSTDIIILTLFSTLKSVSVYSVYHYVVIALTNILQAVTVGVTSLMGNMLSNGEETRLRDFFPKYVNALHMVVIAIFSTAAKMIIPFVRIYTNGIHDVNYEEPYFAMVLIIAYSIYIIRIPYNQTVIAAGHYKKTQRGAILEMTINIVISIIMVFHYGLIGVAVGTLCAMIYRTIYLVNYLSKNILYVPQKAFLKQCMIDLVIVLVIIMEACCFSGKADNYWVWALKTFGSFFLFGFTAILLSCALNFRVMKSYMSILKKAG